MKFKGFQQFCKHLLHNGVILLLVFFIAVPASAQILDLCESGQRRCTVVTFSDATGQWQASNARRSEVRYSPFSTFKIPNSAILLEAGLVSAPDQLLDYDREQYIPQPWWPESWLRTPMTFAQALQRSAVPIYRSLSKRLGEEKMTAWLEKFDYGNRDISSGIDQFWLGGSLTISAKEQIEFLRALNAGELPVSEKSLRELHQMMWIEQQENEQVKGSYRLYAKTGAGSLAKDEALGWYVGWVEGQGQRVYFALNVSAENFDQVVEARSILIEQLLKEITHASQSHRAN